MAKPGKLLQCELQELEQKYNAFGRDRDTLKEAFDLCATMKIPCPEWVIDGIDCLFGNPLFDREFASLTRAYKAGNLGALKDMVYLCREYKQPLPEWANLALFEAISALANGNKKQLRTWSAWLRRYKQDIEDHIVYDLVKDIRERKAEWKDIYAIAGAINKNTTLEKEKDAEAHRIKKACDRVRDGTKQNPYRYKILKTFQKRNDCQPFNLNLWKEIEETIKAGKPKFKKNNKL